MKRKYQKILILSAMMLYCALLMFGLHKCEECGNVYFGQSYSHGEEGSAYICEECGEAVAEA